MKKIIVLVFLAACFSVTAQTIPDTARVRPAGIQKAADSLSVNLGASGQLQAQKIKIIKKEINFSTAVKLAIGMMAFIALMFFTTQSWNPGGVNQ